MSKIDITPGDLVTLKSNGPIMTVIAIVGQSDDIIAETAHETSGYNEGDIICQWFAKDILQDGIFKPISLEKYEPEEVE